MPGEDRTPSPKANKGETCNLFGETVSAEEYNQAVSNLSRFFRLLREWKDKEAREQETQTKMD
jgi:hypothetical protein